MVSIPWTNFLALLPGAQASRLLFVDRLSRQTGQRGNAGTHLGPKKVSPWTSSRPSPQEQEAQEPPTTAPSPAGGGGKAVKLPSLQPEAHRKRLLGQLDAIDRRARGVSLGSLCDVWGVACLASACRNVGQFSGRSSAHGTCSSTAWHMWSPANVSCAMTTRLAKEIISTGATKKGHMTSRRSRS